jgi:hypothetical protein
MREAGSLAVTVASQILGSIRLLVGANILECDVLSMIMVGDVPVDRKTSVVTSSVSRIYRASFRRWSCGQGLRAYVHRVSIRAS